MSEDQYLGFRSVLTAKGSRPLRNWDRNCKFVNQVERVSFDREVGTTLPLVSSSSSTAFFAWPKQGVSPTTAITEPILNLHVKNLNRCVRASRLRAEKRERERECLYEKARVAPAFTPFRLIQTHVPIATRPFSFAVTVLDSESKAREFRASTFQRKTKVHERQTVRFWFVSSPFMITNKGERKREKKLGNFAN